MRHLEHHKRPRVAPLRRRRVAGAAGAAVHTSAASAAAITAATTTNTTTNNNTTTTTTTSSSAGVATAVGAAHGGGLQVSQGKELEAQQRVRDRRQAAPLQETDAPPGAVGRFAVGGCGGWRRVGCEGGWWGVAGAFDGTS